MYSRSFKWLRAKAILKGQPRILFFTLILLSGKQNGSFWGVSCAPLPLSTPLQWQLPLPLQMWKRSSYCPLTINSFFSFISILPRCHGDSHCFKSFRVPSPLTVATAQPAPSLWSLWRLDLSQALDTATTYSSAAAKQDTSPGDSLMELKTLNSPINLTASLNPTSLE